MNKRQRKKRLKNALNILNDIEVVDSDIEREGVIYVLVDNTDDNREKLDKICGLLRINKKIFFKDSSENVDDEYLDLVSIWFHYPEPRGWATYYGYKIGFVLERRKDEESPE